jgi:hypothetical protein
MSASWNARRVLRWTTLAGLLAAIVALNSTPAAADWNGGNGDWNYQRHHHRGYYNNGNGDWNHHRRHHRGYYDNGYGYSYYREQPRYYYQPPTYYYPPPAYYEPPPAYYYAPPPTYYYPQPYYDPSFSFGLTVPIH